MRKTEETILYFCQIFKSRETVMKSRTSPVKRLYLAVRNLGITPAWAVMLIDMLVVFFSVALALFIRENFKFPTSINYFDWLYAPLMIIPVRFLAFLVFQTHHLVVRYTNTRDVVKIYAACVTGSILIFLINVVFFLVNHRYPIPNSVWIIEFFITSTLLVLYRFAFKMYYMETVHPAKSRKNIIIFGAGESGVITKRTIDRDNASKYKVLAFFDEDGSKIGMQLESLPVIAYSKLASYLKKNDISFLIIAVQKISNAKVNEITNISLPFNVKVLKVPPVNRWLNGNLSFKQIRKVRIEDLLSREPIELDMSLLTPELQGKTIMITGAAGSIGSQIVRQLLPFDYGKLVLIDEAETPCFYLTNEMMQTNGMRDIKMHIMDICDAHQMERVMMKYRPDIIYHAAAYKHVPMMEQNVRSAVKVNVGGTKLLADLAVKVGVKKFVMVSTDKAVNPTNVMGASKRIAEMYVQSLSSHQDRTKFVTTRFGNVLDSNGSVIPIFRKQIEDGVPLTVTHPDITRYFMTIKEACQLVITAGAMGQGGEIFIFDMGESVKVDDIAKKMIELSGLKLNRDITIKYTGLRPGEKLYEELLANEENTIKTPHSKIMIAKVNPQRYDVILPEVEKLISLEDENKFVIVEQMKHIVPEYVSNNSAFEALDKEQKNG